MKICPYCKSELTDNAQFCLYCMKSLDEKTVLSAATAKKKPLPWILLALLGLSLAIIIIVLCIVLGKKAPNDKDNSLPTTNSPSIITTEMPTTTATVSATATNSTKPTANSTSAPTVTATNPTATATTESTLKPTATVATGTNTSANPTTTYTTKPTATATSITKPTVKPTAVPTTKPTVNPTATPTNSTKPTATATTKPTATPTLTPTATPTAVPTVAPTAKPTATYSYRAAVSTDDFNNSSSVTANAIVLTGIITPDENGVYYIPDNIGGKKVVAITADFSSNDEIAVTVKKIIIPATVRTVWAGAFSNCVNLSEIYLCGKGASQTIEVEKKALPDVTLRNFEITFHCHSTCMNRDLWQYSSRADTYNAKYEEWDTSTPID